MIRICKITHTIQLFEFLKIVSNSEVKIISSPTATFHLEWPARDDYDFMQATWKGNHSPCIFDTSYIDLRDNLYNNFMIMISERQVAFNSILVAEFVSFASPAPIGSPFPKLCTFYMINPSEMDPVEGDGTPYFE